MCLAFFLVHQPVSFCSWLEQVCRELRRHQAAAEEHLQGVLRVQGRLSSSHESSNPHVAECDSMRELVSEAKAELSELSTRIEHHEGEKLKWKAVEKAFGREGISSFALEGVLLELQVHLTNASTLQARHGTSMVAINWQFYPVSAY